MACGLPLAMGTERCPEGLCPANSGDLPYNQCSRLALSRVVVQAGVMGIPTAKNSAMHLLFGLLMGIQLGLAEYSRQRGRSDVGLHVLLAFLLPVLWHTLFDAATGLNAGLQSNDENVQVVAVIIAFTADAISIALQFVLLSWFKKRTREYCGMRLDTPGSSAGRHAHRAR